MNLSLLFQLSLNIVYCCSHLHQIQSTLFYILFIHIIIATESLNIIHCPSNRITFCPKEKCRKSVLKSEKWKNEKVQFFSAIISEILAWIWDSLNIIASFLAAICTHYTCKGCSDSQLHRHSWVDLRRDVGFAARSSHRHLQRLWTSINSKWERLNLVYCVTRGFKSSIWQLQFLRLIGFLFY